MFMDRVLKRGIQELCNRIKLRSTRVASWPLANTESMLRL
jgi:hypothetical protein